MGRPRSGSDSDGRGSDIDNDGLNAILAHHGIRGMKWGVRRSRKEIEAARSEDSKKVKTIRDKAKSTKVSSLSNNELETAIKRMNLEQQYGQLTSRTKRTHAGSKFAGEVLTNVGKQQATALATKQATKVVAKLLI